MADDRFSWLDEDATERLLRGEPVDALPAVGPEDPAARTRARRLSAALSAVSDPSLLADAADGDRELPGEAAALAAFRAAGAGARRGTAAPSGAAAEPRVVSTSRRKAAGRRHRLARPLRAGLTVALAGCALGGVAVASGADVLRPFDPGSPNPEPRRSVSAATTPSPLSSGEPSAGSPGSGSPDSGSGSTAPPSSPEPGSGSPDGTGSGPAGGEEGRTADGDAPEGTTGSTLPNAEQRRKAALALCRKYEDGSLKPNTARWLEETAGGPEAVGRYCTRLLERGGPATGGGDGGDGGHDGGENETRDDSDDDSGDGTGGPGDSGGAGGAGDGDTGGGTAVTGGGGETGGDSGAAAGSTAGAGAGAAAGAGVDASSGAAGGPLGGEQAAGTLRAPTR